MVYFVFSAISLFFFLITLITKKSGFVWRSFAVLTVMTAVGGIFQVYVSRMFDVADNVYLITVFGMSIFVAALMFFLSYWLVYRNGLKPIAAIPIISGLIIAALAKFILNYRLKDMEKSKITDAAFFFSLFFLLSIISSFIGLLISALRNGGFLKDDNYDFIIVHGARVFGTKPSLLLSRRIDKAFDVYTFCGKKAKIIASGGKGSDEDISEASAIEKALIKKGVAKSDVLIEDASTSTAENLLMSKRIGDAYKYNARYVFVTSSYHAFRVNEFAKKLGVIGDAVGAPTRWYYYPAGVTREYFAAVVNHKCFSACLGLISIAFSLISIFVS